jgi:hypothetical protein
LTAKTLAATAALDSGAAAQFVFFRFELLESECSWCGHPETFSPSWRINNPRNLLSARHLTRNMSYS